jgi:hypothetical protein
MRSHAFFLSIIYPQRGDGGRCVQTSWGVTCGQPDRATDRDGAVAYGADASSSGEPLLRRVATD